MSAGLLPAAMPQASTDMARVLASSLSFNAKRTKCATLGTQTDSSAMPGLRAQVADVEGAFAQRASTIPDRLRSGVMKSTQPTTTPAIPDSIEGLHDAPLALSSAGAVIANCTHLLRADDIHELLDQALSTGREVFVGVVLRESEVAEALGRLDDAAAEIVARVVRV